MNIPEIFKRFMNTDDSDKDKTPTEVVGTRKHIVMLAREDQLDINILGWHGGRPYVNTRLSRFAGETDVDWFGGTRGSMSVTGRREQSHNLPYLNRIVDKINQYTFAVDPKREDADEKTLKDITRTGESINQVMAEVNSYLTVSRWCWMKVDAPSMGGEEVTEKEKEDQKIRPYWSVLSPTSIVDWKIDDQGAVLWTIEEWTDYRADDPTVEPEAVLMRTLWEPGKATDYEFRKKARSSEYEWFKIDEKDLSMTEEVPMFPVGEISAMPHFFDDTESVNRSIMNLGSCNYANFFRCVYPQLYLPASVLATVMETFKVNAQKAVDMILGYNYPIFLAPDDVVPDYIMPDAGTIGTIRKEIEELVVEMFGTIGLINPTQTKTAQSGISKEYDFQDIIAVVRERADILEEAETKAVALSVLWDPEFKAWTPEYNRAVSIGNIKEAIDTIIAGDVIDMPIELKRLQLKRYYEMLKKLGSGQVEEEVQQVILEALTAFEAKELTVPTSVPVEEELDE